MKYDDASWHYGGDFPEESPEEYAATHIALMLKWCFLKGWAGDIHFEEEASKSDMQKIYSGAMSATDYFLQWCDGKLTDEDVNDDGERFLNHYYGDKGTNYLSDYAKVFGDLMYVESESSHDFTKFSEMVENRYQIFIGAKKPWWKFW